MTGRDLLLFSACIFLFYDVHFGAFLLFFACFFVLFSPPPRQAQGAPS
jgi:hypothetical protein